MRYYGVLFHLALAIWLAAPPATYAAENWFTDSPQKQCAKITQASQCACPPSALTPVTGGGANILFFMPLATVPFATLLSGASGYCARNGQTCQWYAFEIEGNAVACEKFFSALQAQQQKCRGCIVSKTQPVM